MATINPKVVALASAPDVVSATNNHQKEARLRTKRASMVLDEIDVFHRVEAQHKEDLKKAGKGTLLAFSVAGMLVPTLGSVSLACHVDMKKEERVTCYTNAVGAIAAITGAMVAGYGIRDYCARRAHLNSKIALLDATMGRRLAVVNSADILPTVINDFFSQYVVLSNSNRQDLVAKIKAKI